MSDIPQSPALRQAAIPRKARPIWQVATVLVLLGLLALVGWRMVNRAGGPHGSGPVPDFSLTGFDGRTLTLSQLRAGRHHQLLGLLVRPVP